MPKKEEEKNGAVKSISWFSKLKTSFFAFFSWLKATFIEISNFDADADTTPTPKPPKVVKPKGVIIQSLYPPERCKTEVQAALVGADFFVKAEELALIEKEIEDSKAAYTASHISLAEEYFTKDSVEALSEVDIKNKRYRAELQASRFLENSVEKLAFNQAQKKASVLKKEHAEAFTYAIQKYGTGKELKLNGFCLDRLQNVGGNNNNCGANVMLHIFLEHWEHLDFKKGTPALSLAIDLRKAANRYAGKKLGIKGTNKLKEHIKAFSFEQQETTFTPVVRAHLAKTLNESRQYYEAWVQEQFPELDKNSTKEEQDRSHSANFDWDRALYSSKEYNEYYTYRFLSSEEKAKLSPEKKARMKQLERALFESRYARLGNENNAIEIAEYELMAYARIMGFKLKVYDKQGMVMMPRLIQDDGSDLICVNVVNSGACHWQYECTSDAFDKYQLQAQQSRSKSWF